MGGALILCKNAAKRRKKSGLFSKNQRLEKIQGFEKNSMFFFGFN